MIRALIDGHVLGVGEGGNERYVSGLVKALLKRKDVDLRVLTSRRVNWLDRKNYKVLENLENNISRYSRMLSVEAESFGADVVHTSYFRPLLPKKIKSTVMIHDLAFYRFPLHFGIRDLLKFRLLSPLSMKKCDRIIVPSKFVSSEVKHFFPSLEHKTWVIHEGVGESFYGRGRMGQKKQESFEGSKKYFLLFDSGYRRKRIDEVIKTYKRGVFWQKGINLVIVGYEGFQKRKVNGVRYVQGLSDEKLRSLYHDSLGLIAYSSYEGFGLPILEALASGSRVIASSIPAHIEIGGNLPTYVSDECELMKEMEKLVEKKSTNKQKKRAKAWVKSFSWDKTALETMKVWKKVLQS